MSIHEDDHSSKHHHNHFPLDSSSYKILSEIGLGVSAIVYKAICIPTNATVAIKAIDLDQSKTDDIDTLRRETKTMSLLTHPNILNAHCSFIVDNKLWVVMPFMSCGSLHSIMSSNYHNGLTEPCIAIILKETLKALCYLHDQGHVHRDIKSGNILVDANGAVKLADFGVSASIYESGSASFATSSLTDVAGTPYWMAPEVIHSHNGYSFKADIWSFGITALELAHGRPPLSNLPPSTSLFMKITKRFRFSDYEKHSDPSGRSSNNAGHDHKKFSKSFKDMVGCCLDQDPSKRPTADKLLKHSFFKNCKCVDYLVRNVLQGLTSVEERFKLDKFSRSLSMNVSGNKDCADEEEENMSEGVRKQRRISGWNFNEDGFELDPVFRNGESSTIATRPVGDDDDEFIVKNVRFGGESIILDTQSDRNNRTEPEAEEEPLLLSPQPQASEESQVLVLDSAEESHQAEAKGETVDGVSSSGGVINGAGREFMLGTLDVLRRSLKDELLRVNNLISLLGGVVGESREEMLVETVQRLSLELENERKRRSELELELWRHNTSGSRY